MTPDTNEKTSGIPDGHGVGALASREWASYIEPLLPLAEEFSGYLTDPADAQLRRELYRSLFAEMSAAFLGLLYADPRHPDFWPFSCQVFSLYLANPDVSAYATPIEDDGVYRISGFRGTVRRIDFQIGTGKFFPRGVPDEKYLGVTLANYFLDDDVHVNADGSFEVILSRERPAGYTGDWWKLGEGASYILIRQVSYDWINEIDGRFGIERLDLPAAKPRPSAARLEEDLRQIAKWISGSMKVTAEYVKLIRQNQGINKIEYWDLVNYSALTTQRYAYGGFDLQPGEALLIEVKVPKQARYWSVHLTDDLGFTPDWMHRQNNLNGFTARIDTDGMFRAVISAEDPGIANWLDTAGYKTGAIQFRWEKCDEFPARHETKLIKTAEIRSHIPAGTPSITPEVRDTMLRLRRKGAQMRKRW